jgi:DNA-binding Lrp family transcriptional regulator
VGLLGGDYQFGVSVCVKTIRELSEFLDRLSSKFGNVFFEKSMAAIGNLTHFRMKYLSSKRGSRDFLSIVDSGDRLAIDETDHEILKSLSSGKASSLREIERETGIAHSTVEYRIKRLEANGVIIGYSYLVDTSVLGIQMYLLLLYVKAVEKSFKAALFDFCKTHRNVNFLIEYLGAWDYEVGVEVETSKEIISIIEDFYMRFGDVLNTIRVMQVFEYPKVSKYPFRSFEHLR